MMMFGLFLNASKKRTTAQSDIVTIKVLSRRLYYLWFPLSWT